jgi:uncharacterized RDD family membrane protein YckC
METTPFYVASTYRRMAASMVDSLFWIIPASLFFMTGHFRFDSSGGFFSWGAYLFLILFTLLFETFFLVRFSQSPGKMLLRLYVVDANTKIAKLSVSQAFLRSISKNLYVFFSLAPAAVALFREDRRQTLDLIAGTQVMQKEKRQSPAKKRWVVGSLLLIYFLFASLYNLANTFKYIEFQSDGIYVHNNTSSSPGKKHHEPVN